MWFHKTLLGAPAAYSKIFYIVEPRNWVIAKIGKYITEAVKTHYNVDSRLQKSCRGISGQIIHFGSKNLLSQLEKEQSQAANKLILTWYHGSPNNPTTIPRLPLFQKIIASCSIGKKKLTALGIPESKIEIIPLGVDLKRFAPPLLEQREHIRKQLGIPPEAVCIGSFQKDGVGWGSGNHPKLVKGPDLFLKAVERLAKCYPLFILLTGPSRGYVKAGLKHAGIPFRHLYFKDPDAMAFCYHCLDLYLITSRDEGGPLALLEAMATGVPVVSTQVGMAADLLRDAENGCLVEPEDIDGIVKGSEQFLQHPEIKQRCVRNALRDVAPFDWSSIARQHYERVYQHLLI